VALTERDFLLYMATVSGGYALRNLMIPCCVEELSRNSPAQCMSEAFTRASDKVSARVRVMAPESETGQVSEVRSTLRKKFALINNFLIPK